MIEKESELLVVYEVEQLAPLQETLASRPRAAVLSLDAEVDMLLKDTGIPFYSIQEFTAETETTYVLADTIASTLESEAWGWFTYRDVQLAKVFIPTFQDYIQQCLYYVVALDAFLTKHQQFSTLTALASEARLPAFGGFFARRKIEIVSYCASFIATHRGLRFQVAGVPKVEVVSKKIDWFILQRTVFSTAIGVLNTCVALVRGRGSVRILASDYWRNISPVLSRIENVELILCDRKEIANAGLKNVWKYRIRFIHPAAFISGTQRARDAEVERLQRFWVECRATVVGSPAVGTIALQSLLEDVIDEIMQVGVPAVVREVDEVYAMFESLTPDMVMLRASVSQQWHFSLLALVAKCKGVPSLELLHGMEYPGPGSLDRRHLAQFVGVYGAHTQRQMVSCGFLKSDVPVIGSPRFDPYELRGIAKGRSAREVQKKFTIFCTAPDLYIGATFDTYDIERYFKAVAEVAAKIPNGEVLVKLRPGKRRESFYRRAIAEAFASVPHTIAQYEPLRTLFPQADVAVSCQTTVTLEALQCGVPLVLFAATKLEKTILTFNFAELAKVGAAAVCTTPEVLSDVLHDLATHPQKLQSISDTAAQFLEKEYAFDGKGADRAAAFVCKATLN